MRGLYFVPLLLVHVLFYVSVYLKKLSNVTANPGEDVLSIQVLDTGLANASCPAGQALSPPVPESNSLLKLQMAPD